jgi:Tol biopolymer transport system component
VRIGPSLVLAVFISLVPSAHGVELRAIPPIVFSTSRADGDLVIQRADGSGRRVATRGSRNDSSPSWSPEGTRVAFTEFTTPGIRINVLDLKTGRVRFLGHGANPDWSPDGKRLVFIAFGKEPDLATMDATGANRRLLGVTAARVHARTRPAWAPRGPRIAFVGGRGLFVVDEDGSELRRLTVKGKGGGASWSPSGRRIAFDCGTRAAAVCVVRPNGSAGLKNVTRKGHHPSWSPRGNLIALASYNRSAIILVRPDGTFVRELPAKLDTSPDWSPDGRRLVVSHSAGSGHRLYATDPDANRLERLTEGFINEDLASAWSPNGRWIAFHRQLVNRCFLELLDIETGRVRHLLQTRTDQSCFERPDWSHDGRSILYARKGDLWVISRRGGRPRRVTRSKVEEQSPRWAPDGRSIGFVARGGIWLLRDGRRRLLVDDANRFAWSHDGSMLAYEGYETPTSPTSIYLRVGSQPPRMLFQYGSGPPSWSPDDDRIVFLLSDPKLRGGSLAIGDMAGNAQSVFGGDAMSPDWRP